MNPQEMAVKSQALKALGTKELCESIAQREEELNQALLNEANYKNENVGFLSSIGGNDCSEVKRLLAELAANAPAKIDDKKTNAAEREAWLVKQRSENAEVKAAIGKQAEVAFQLENLKIQAEMAKRRYERLRQTLHLKIAQIEFLAERG